MQTCGGREVRPVFIKHSLESVFSVTHLINASSYHISADYTSPGEKHDFWEIVYVDRGMIHIRADNNELPLNNGEIVFHQPDEYHNVIPVPDSEADIIVISFVCANKDMSAFNRRVITVSKEEKDCLVRIAKEAEKTYLFFENIPPVVKLVRRGDAPFGAEQLIRGELEKMLICLYRRINDQALLPPPEKSMNRHVLSSNNLRHNEELAQLAREYIGQHYGEKLTLAGIAASLNISISQLKLIFREQINATVIQYLTNLRIREAKRLIREHQFNLTQIADMVGFESISYFSSRFKHVTGMTPTEYARILRQDE